MALKIRLRQQGRRNRRSFRLVVTEATARRDGEYLEALGWFDPQGREAEQLCVKSDRVRHWLEHGAQLTDKAEALVRKMAPELIAEQNAREEAKRAKRRVERKGAAV